MARIVVDGKQFSRDGKRFHFRGVTYGTFRPRPDGARFPQPEHVRRDFRAMQDAGFSVVRTYTVPPDDIVACASEAGLYLLVDVFYPDWRYLVGGSTGEKKGVRKQARAAVRAAARRFAGNDHILALSLGNEVPADVLRWVGTKTVARTIEELVEVVKDEDPQRLVTYTNYPTAEYLPLDRLDFLSFNVFLEERQEFRRYLGRLHTLAGDRPLVLSEIGLNAGTDAEGERRQAEAVDWQLETALERGVAGTCLFAWTDEWWVGGAAVGGWHFGLTRHDRTPRLALEVARRWNGRTVQDLDFRWPSISVVICAYNAAATLDECLEATSALDYPDLEILVVDDGSTDATSNIAGGYPRVRVLKIGHAGLAAARNEGLRATSGDLVAYLDSDAYPTPEWPYYLALGLDRPDVGGVGGPNLPAPHDPVAAQRTACAPGGPIHVLLSDDRAEHVPGCNMAFWRLVLEEVGGFDPVYTSAGDDVDLCWRVLDRGWQIAFHPAAFVWHHRRAGVRSYLRQQWGYGRSEALVEARHPTRFTATGTARWRGRIYDHVAPGLTRQRVYRGPFGAAAYQSVYQGGGYALDLAHQVGVPLAMFMLAPAPLAFVWPAVAILPLAALAYLGLLLTLDMRLASRPLTLRGSSIGFRFGVAFLHLAQPLCRTAGRLLHAATAWRDLAPPTPLPGPVIDVAPGVVLMPADRPRADLAAAIVAHLRRAGLRVIPTSGWEDYDARIIGSSVVIGDLITSAYPQGSVQLRVRRRLRSWPLLGVAVLVGIAALIAPPAAAVLALAAVAELMRGLRRTGKLVGTVVQAAAEPDLVSDRTASQELARTNSLAPVKR